MLNNISQTGILYQPSNLLIHCWPLCKLTMCVLLCSFEICIGPIRRSAEALRVDGNGLLTVSLIVIDIYDMVLFEDYGCMSFRLPVLCRLLCHRPVTMLCVYRVRVVSASFCFAAFNAE